MKKHFRFTNSKTQVATVIATSITGLLLGLSFVPRTANGAFDFDGLSNQVQQQQEQLNNHEARISNTEKDVKDLQDNTGTSPAGNRASVPSTSGSVAPSSGGGSTTPPAAPVAPNAQPTEVEAGHYVRYVILTSNCTGKADGNYYYYGSDGTGLNTKRVLTGSDAIPSSYENDSASNCVTN